MTEPTLRTRLPITIAGETVGEIYLDEDTLETVKRFVEDKALIRLTPNSVTFEPGQTDILSFSLLMLSSEY